MVLRKKERKKERRKKTKCTQKHYGLKTTQIGLFGKPALGKNWTEH
jgi:hypothetical protein